MSVTTYCREHACMFSLADWTQIEVRGSDGPNFLQNFCTNDILKMPFGGVCEAFFCDMKGRILAHAIITRWHDLLMLHAVPGAAGIILSHLTRYLLDADAQLVDVSSERQLLCLIGKNLKKSLASMTPAITLPSEHSGLILETNVGALELIHIPLLMPPCLLVSGSSTAIEAFEDACRSADISAGTPEEFEFHRIAAGFPWCGRDITSANIAQEAARTQNAINFTKGCYLGQEPIARLDAVGHTNRELRRLKIDDDDASVRPGQKLFANENEVGTLTSVATCEGHTLGLAMLRSAATEPQTHLQIKTDEKLVDATVLAIPCQ